jgi:hypothetical protein
VGRIEVRDGTFIRAALVEFRGKLYVDLREFVETDRYKGPTKKGMRFNTENWPAFRELVETLDAEIKRRY